MICTSRIQAGKVAAAGADKMERTGYRTSLTPVANVYAVTKPDASATYTVIEKAEAFTCNCEFFNANAQYEVCKHIVSVIRHKEESARCDALAEQFARPIDCEEIDILRPVVKLATIERDADLIDPYYVAPTRREDTGEWPSCPLHGPYRAFNGRPDLDCWKCQKLRS